MLLLGGLPARGGRAARGSVLEQLWQSCQAVLWHSVLCPVSGGRHSQGWQGSGSLDDSSPITWGSLTLLCLTCGQELCLVAVGSGDGRAVVLNAALASTGSLRVLGVFC